VVSEIFTPIGGAHYQYSGPKKVLHKPDTWHEMGYVITLEKTYKCVFREHRLTLQLRSTHTSFHSTWNVLPRHDSVNAVQFDYKLSLWKSANRTL